MSFLTIAEGMGIIDRHLKICRTCRDTSGRKKREPKALLGISNVLRLYMRTTSMEELKKDRECLHCDKFFECKGKPKDVKECLQFVERKDLKGSD